VRTSSWSMLTSYEDCLAAIENEAVERCGIADFRVAREEFHNLTGKFEDGESWFELRMTMFIDWYLLDRVDSEGITPAEGYLIRHQNGLTDQERDQLVHLTATLRSIFRIVSTKDEWLELEDIAGGGIWRARSTMPTVGLNPDDLIGARIVFLDGDPTIVRGTVLHPREATEVLYDIVERAQGEKMPPRELVDHSDKMRLKFDRYSNVRIQHVYRYPGDAVF
jgi:hypothetical protein